MGVREPSHRVLRVHLRTSDAVSSCFTTISSVAEMRFCLCFLLLFCSLIPSLPVLCVALAESCSGRGQSRSPALIACMHAYPASRKAANDVQVFKYLLHLPCSCASSPWLHLSSRAIHTLQPYKCIKLPQMLNSPHWGGDLLGDVLHDVSEVQIARRQEGSAVCNQASGIILMSVPQKACL